MGRPTRDEFDAWCEQTNVTLYPQQRAAAHAILDGLTANLPARMSGKTFVLGLVDRYLDERAK